MATSGPPGLPHGAGSRGFCLIVGSQSGTNATAMSWEVAAAAALAGEMQNDGACADWAVPAGLLCNKKNEAAAGARW